MRKGVVFMKKIMYPSVLLTALLYYRSKQQRQTLAQHRSGQWTGSNGRRAQLLHFQKPPLKIREGKTETPAVTDREAVPAASPTENNKWERWSGKTVGRHAPQAKGYFKWLCQTSVSGRSAGQESPQDLTRSMLKRQRRLISMTLVALILFAENVKETKQTLC